MTSEIKSDVPELVRYDLACDFDGKKHPDIIEVELGEYVRYDQAAAVIAEKDKEIEGWKEIAGNHANKFAATKIQLNTAEAKLAQYLQK